MKAFGIIAGFFVAMSLYTVVIWNLTHPAPLPKPAQEFKVEKVEPPLTNWTNFYERLFRNEYEIALTVGVTTDDDRLCQYDIYLVDGDNWIKVESGRGFRGCGAPVAVNRFFVMFNDDFLNRLKSVPSDKARFVAVGTHKVKIVEQKIRYFNRETGKQEGESE